MIYRITYGFAGPAGWTETHAMLNASSRPQDLVPTLSDIAQKRAQMLGREFYINGIRISRYSDDAGNRQRGSFLVKQIYRNTIQTQSAAAEPADVALLVRGSAEPSVLQPQFDSNQNQTFLGGPLDVCVDNAGEVDPGKGGLGAAFASWRSAMLGTTMGWLASQTIVDTPITAITSQPNGTVQFTIDLAAMGPLVIGQRYRARVRRVNSGNSPLNGELIVVPTGPGLLTSVEVIGLALDQLGGSIRVYKAVAPFVDYGDLVLSSFTARHKRGRPFLSPPGRAKKRIRG